MFKKTLAIIIALAIIFSPFTVTSVKADTAGIKFYIAVTGNDTNSGTIGAPFKTLERARDAIRSLKDSSGLPEGGVAVYLRGGTYQRTGSFKIEEQDSGTAGKPIVYQAYPGEAVSISGGIELDKSWFTPVTDTQLKNRIVSEDARKKLLMVDMKSHGIIDYGEISRHGYWKANDVSKVPPMELYLDGKRMTLARWPNNSTVQMGDIVDPGPKQGEPDLQTRGGTFKYGYDRPKYWTQADDIWVDGIFGYSWEWSYNKVAQIDTVKKEITLGYGEMSRLNKNWYPDFHFFENLFEEIDMPGEYYIDRTNGILYLLPTAAFNNGNPRITVTMLDKPMLVSEGASYTTFKDLTLEYGRDCATQITGGSNVLITQCDISNFTNSGILINSKSRFLYDVGDLPTDGKNHGVTSCQIHNIGGTAVTLSGGNLDTLERADNFVENCHIHDFAYYHKAYNPGVLLSGVGNTASHNKLHDAPHPGILIFGNDHLVEYNDISNVCANFSDLGAIYMNEGETPQHSGTAIRRNYFHNIGENRDGVQGVYPDNFTFGVTIEENIFYKMGNAAINNNSGSYIISQNNMFIDCKTPYNNSDYFQDGNQVRNVYMPKWQELFARYNNFQGMPHLKYPQLSNFFEEDRVLITSNVYKNNLIYNPTLPLSPMVKQGAADPAVGAFDKYNLLQASGNWLAASDPGFADLAAGDFNLKADADLYNHMPGFKSIPFNEIGLTGKVGTSTSADSIAVTNVYFGNEGEAVDVAKTLQLQTEVAPWNASNRKLHYSVSDTSIATVDEKGLVTGRTVGNVTVVVTSDENPSITDTCNLTVNAGDGILHNTDFENGANGWGVDANHPVVADSSGNHWYKILKGANSQSPVAFSDYILEFKLKTPETIPNGVFFMIYERANTSGTGRIGYFVNKDGVPRWDIMDNSWTVLNRNTNINLLQPDTVYNMKVLAEEKEISLYVNDELIVKATNPSGNTSGKVGFYVENFDYLMFDDVKFSLPGETG